MTTQKPSPSSSHDDVWAILPWYVNGTLNEEDTTRVRNHIRLCLPCRREITVQQSLHESLRHAPIVEISARPSFERLMARIDREDRMQITKTANEKTHALRTRWGEILERLLTPGRFSIALALSLAAALTWSLIVQEMTPEEPKSYRTVANAGSFEGFAPHDVRVAFADTATEPEIRKLLESINGEITDGPNSLGLYTVRLKDTDAPESSYLQFLQRLRRNDAVSFAEPAIPLPLSK